ncbi:MAG TPA: hypothetical protein ENJ17_01205 [Gammaproteobacteria bacterium]|nr:hypothetical protein [Gammaproteobacteria bacterium]
MKTKLFGGVGIFCFLLVIALALGGCKEASTYAVNVPVVAANLVLLDQEIDSARDTVASRMDQFTPEEQASLRSADQEIQALRESVKRLVDENGGVARALVNADEVRMLVKSARNAYRDVRMAICPDVSPSVVLTSTNCKRLAEMPPLDRMTLTGFDAKVQRTKAALSVILSAGEGADVTQAIVDTISIGAAAARVMLASGAL